MKSPNGDDRDRELLRVTPERESTYGVLLYVESSNDARNCAM
jgi:hypothetical protein